jgi:hypothetical protein
MSSGIDKTIFLASQDYQVSRTGIVRISSLFADRFWLVFALGAGAVILFIAFPVVAVLLLLVAVALGLINYNTKKG